MLGSMPLIAWTISAARKSRFLDRCILSSDDEEIIRVARDFGCEVPFVRPASLAGDNATSADVLLHAMESLDTTYDYTVLLQPTSPFRTSEDIDAGIELCVKTGAPSVVSVREAREKPEWMCVLDGENRMRFPYALDKADVAPLNILNGAFYVVRSDCFTENGLFTTPETKALVMPWERSIDIDTQEDWLMAEFVLQKAALEK